jgi:hypothetical protein
MEETYYIALLEQISRRRQSEMKQCRALGDTLSELYGSMMETERLAVLAARGGNLTAQEKEPPPEGNGSAEIFHYLDGLSGRSFIVP